MSDARQILIQKYFDDRLGARDAEEFRRLMADDPEFAERLVRHALDEQLLAGALSLQAGAEALPPAAAAPRGGSRPWLAPLAAAAAVLVAVGGALWLSTLGGQGEVVARVEKVSGFNVQCSGKSRVTLRVGDEVRAGARIETEKDGALKLAWIRESTTLDVAGNSKLETRNSKLAYLGTGRAAVTVAKQDAASPFVVETPQARVTVVGTRFSLLVSEAPGASEDTQHSSLSTHHSALGSTRVDVDEGKIRLERLSDGATVEVGAGWFGLAGEGLAQGPHEAGTVYVDGPVIQTADLGRFKDEWVVTAGESPAPDPAALEKYLAVESVTWQGQTTKCLVLDTRTAPTTVALRRKSGLPPPPCSAEWKVFAGTNSPLTRTLSGAATRSDALPPGWCAERMEVVPNPASGGCTMIHYLNGQAVARNGVSERQVTQFSLSATKGTLVLTGLTIRQMVRAPGGP
jgi:ferric-dicitrate binding protein FerR (iron transport regulator)